MMTITVWNCVFLPPPQPETITSKWETNFICLPLPLFKTWSRNMGLEHRDDREMSLMVTRVTPFFLL